jgi:hypothetical protein
MLVMKRFSIVAAVGLVVAAMVVAGSLPIFAARGTAKAKGQAAAEVGACTVDAGGGTSYSTIQSAVDDESCTTIEVNPGTYTENVSIDRNVTIQGVDEETTFVVGPDTGSSSVFTVLQGSTVTLQSVIVRDGFARQGGGVYNAGTLTLDNAVVFRNTAYQGGGIYNGGTLTLVGTSGVATNTAHDGGGIFNEGIVTLDDNATVDANTAANEGSGVYNGGTLNICEDIVQNAVRNNYSPSQDLDNVAGNPAQGCPTSPPPGGSGPGNKGESVRVDHQGKELCLPTAALNGHRKHGDEVLDENGCSATERRGHGGNR